MSRGLVTGDLTCLLWPDPRAPPVRYGGSRPRETGARGPWLKPREQDLPRGRQIVAHVDELETAPGRTVMRLCGFYRAA